MKKSFAIAFIILVILLLVLRKQTEPAVLKAAKPVVATPTPMARATPEAPALGPTTAASATPSASSVTGAVAVTPEKLQELRSTIKIAAVNAYTAQRATQAEWERFTSDISYTGWAPELPDLNYKMGFLSAFNAPPIDEKEKPDRFSTDSFINEELYESSQKVRYTPAAEKIRLSDYAKYCEHGCVASKDSFEILLVIPLDDQGHVDVWTMNDKKELRQALDGTALR